MVEESFVGVKITESYKKLMYRQILPIMIQ